MLRRDIYNCIDRVLDLPLREQSLCVWLASEPVVSIWTKWCTQKNVNDHSNEYIDCYSRWRLGTATDEEFKTIAQLLQSVLPEDLRLEENPTGGMAGWSLVDVAMIALDQCEDVHQDIFATALAYAAAAATENRNVPIGIDWDRLTDAEMHFMDTWWYRCLSHLPQLNAPDRGGA